MTRTFIGVVLIMLSAIAVAGGDATAGKAKAAICIACHGPDGNSVNPEWPSIAGQHEKYLASQMNAIKAGESRKAPLMAPMVATLTEQDFADLAAYYASLPRRGMMANEQNMEQITLGEKLYRGGNKETGVAACMACHGPDGSGNNLAGFPMLGAQYAKYTAMQLHAFRDGTRTNDPQSMMRDVAKRLTDEEIAAVSEYLVGLRH